MWSVGCFAHCRSCPDLAGSSRKSAAGLGRVCEACSGFYDVFLWQLVFISRIIVRCFVSLFGTKEKVSA